jgi:hypothetical protein
MSMGVLSGCPVRGSKLTRGRWRTQSRHGASGEPSSKIQRTLGLYFHERLRLR